MAAGVGGSTRDRVLDAAMRLFGAQGYAATTIAQIEAAAGLSPGSGSLYRHFRSKQELLEAGVRVQLQGAADLRALLDEERGLTDLPLDERLHAVLRVAIARLERGRDLVRMLLRDAGAFPELMARLRDDQMTRAGEAMARWLSHQPELAGAERDWHATAAVLVAAVSHYWLLRDAFGSEPFGVDEQRFVTVLTGLVTGAHDPKRGDEGGRGGWR
jgi:AcrR family transcriptional regulator